MISITEYLKGIYKDLESYVDENVYLCDLKKLNFKAGAVPDYEDINIQRLYLLRYAFAYAFEYSQMYSEVLSDIGDCNQISVTSVGCGAMIDYWALVHALEKKNKMDTSIRYVGIDKINWNYRFSKRENDEVSYLVKDAKDAFINDDQLVSDVYFFPKSISEFSEDELNIIADRLSSKQTVKNKFFLCVSLRDDEGSMQRDIQRVKCLIEAIKQKGFCTEWNYKEYMHYRRNDGIAAFDNNFQYPSEALQFITNLNKKCANYKIQEENCQDDCQEYLSRWPILRVGHIKYQVIIFERAD